jgi:CDP-diacylglycerol--glycerol-3-phosphate 3-phosphatidyltransferase
MLDLACSLGLFVAVALLAVARGMARTIDDAADLQRIEREGASPLLGRGAMRSAYWALRPVVRACVAAGVSANAITALSAAAGLAAGVLVATGHLGIAALVVAMASIADALDGLVARTTGTASATGALFDAAVDRYQELALLSGLAFWFRERPLVLGLALLAIGGSFMVSYGSAKAEALHVVAPRGAMRRAERAVYLDAGLALSPIAARLASAVGLPAASGDLPIVLALAVVGIVANVSAVRRLRALGSAADGRSKRVSAATASAPAE